MTRPRAFLLLGLATGLGLFAGFVALTGGIDVRLAGVPLRSRSWERPAVLAALAALPAAVGLRRDIASGVRWILAAAPRVHRFVAVAAVCWAGVAAIEFGTFAVGGSDSYGYVSQAELLARGRLVEVVPRNPAFTWPDVPTTLTPLAYKRGRTSGTLAPVYPPGLPLLMAPLAATASGAVFLVVPLCAMAAVLLCWKLGGELGDPLAGAAAALLFSLSPTFLYQAVQPMSDVPVTAFWLGALLIARQPTRWSPVVAGLLVSIAILIRPNLAPLALLVAAASTVDRIAVRRLAAYAAAMVPGLILLAAIQYVRYGSPLASGYGTFDELFGFGNVGPNLSRYPRWLTETHTPLIWVWLLAPVWLVRAAPGVRRFGWICYGCSVAVIVAYLPYVYFRPEEWFYTRFLLPAIPLMLLLAAGAANHGARRVAPRVGTSLLMLGCLALAGVFAWNARSVGVFRLASAEQKYPAVGAFIRARLPASAFLIAMQHSGSIRYYAGRQTLRWDLLDRASLDRAVVSLRAAGYEPFAVLDPDEDSEFRRRFATASSPTLSRMVPVGAVGRTTVYAFP
jgi:hypothetical protein